MDLKQLAATATERIAAHGLVGWTFGLTDAKRRLGVCKYSKKRIEISRYYATHNTDAEVLDTLLHEIAHAIAGHAAGHGPEWQEVAVRVGASPRACAEAGSAVLQPGDWQTTCPACNKTYHRFRRPVSVSGFRCGCPARSPLVFAFTGDPAREPPVPQTHRQAARWQAKCAGCGTTHRRLRRPKPGIWQCRCAARTKLSWQFVSVQPEAE